MKIEIKFAMAAMHMMCIASAFARDGMMHGRFILAERGKTADCAVTLPPDPTEADRYAAAELTNFIRRLTGVVMPVVTDVPASGKAVVLSKSVAASGLDADGFKITQKGEWLVLEGGSDRGLLYAAYGLLEKFGGCRWYSSWCDRIPSIKSLSVPAGYSAKEEPAFLMRDVFWYDVIKNPDFTARLRVNCTLSTMTPTWRMEILGKRLPEKKPVEQLKARHGGARFGFGAGLGLAHTMFTLLPPKDYFAAHPDWFCMRDGNRVNNTRPDRESQLCFSNHEAAKAVASNMRERIRKDPGRGFYGVSQMDSRFYCQCERCAAIDAEEASHAGALLRFVNAVAEDVEKEFPDAKIETLAYLWSRKPPSKTRPRRNVVPCLCSIECDFSRPIGARSEKTNAAFCDDLTGWCGICQGLLAWDYTTSFGRYLTPFPNVLALAENIRFFARHNVRYYLGQGAYNGRHADFAELKAWLSAKLLWNPDAPVEGLLEDFFSGYYGPASKPVREYFDALHKLDIPHLPFNATPMTKGFTDEFLNGAWEKWERAAAAVKDAPEVFRYNVRMGQIPVLYAMLYRMPRAAVATTEAQRERRKWLVATLQDRLAEAGDVSIREAIDPWSPSNDDLSIPR